MLIKLEKPKRLSSKQAPWKACLPFVDNSRATLIHRPRSGSTYNIHKAPGQPYEKQWWMKYWEVEISQPSEQDRKVYGDRACKVKARFKKNRFTGAIYVFRFNCKPRGNRWNEPGYGWGVWEKL